MTNFFVSVCEHRYDSKSCSNCQLRRLNFWSSKTAEEVIILVFLRVVLITRETENQRRIRGTTVTVQIDFSTFTVIIRWRIIVEACGFRRTLELASLNIKIIIFPPISIVIYSHKSKSSRRKTGTVNAAPYYWCSGNSVYRISRKPAVLVPVQS